MSLRRWIMVIFVGGLGTLVLISLGVWQLQRLEQKEARIAEIEAMASSAPGSIPLEPTEVEHEYLPVRVSGTWQIGEAHVLTSVKGQGPGFRIVAPLRISDGRRILVDRGFVLERAKEERRPVGRAEITGHLVWPNETDSFTPEADLEDNFWFARDVDVMAQHLGTEPILLVAAQTTQLGAPQPQPANVTLPNNHLSYAIQWFGLAAVWAAMTGLFVVRSRQKSEGVAA